MELTTEQKKVIAGTKDILNVTQTDNGFVFIETKPPQNIPIIMKGSRCKITNSKGIVCYGIISTVKDGIAKMIYDDGVYNIRAPIHLFTLSDKPIIPSNLKCFKFKACIHPKNGGDDYMINGTTKAINETDARKDIEQHLKRKSVIIDYIFV